MLTAQVCTNTDNSSKYRFRRYTVTGQVSLIDVYGFAACDLVSML